MGKVKGKKRSRRHKRNNDLVNRPRQSWERPRTKSSQAQIVLHQIVRPNIWISTSSKIVFDVHCKGNQGNLTVEYHTHLLDEAIQLGLSRGDKYILIIHGGQNREGTWVKYLESTYKHSLKPWKEFNPGVSILYLGGLNTGCQ